MDENKVRVIKISSKALFEFIYEKFIEEQACYLEVDPLSVINTFDIDWDNGKFIFCAHNSEDSEGNLLHLPDGIDLKRLMKLLPDTTETMFAENRYKEYTKEELEAMSKADTIISLIDAKYHGSIILHSCLALSVRSEAKKWLPQELYNLLLLSDGISESMKNPVTGEPMTISWIIYPYQEIAESTRFFSARYGLDGTVFSDDGCGNPFILKADGKVTSYHVIDGEEQAVADSLYSFLQPEYMN